MTLPFWTQILFNQESEPADVTDQDKELAGVINQDKNTTNQDEHKEVIPPKEDKLEASKNEVQDEKEISGANDTDEGPFETPEITEEEMPVDNNEPTNNQLIEAEPNTVDILLEEEMRAVEVEMGATTGESWDTATEISMELEEREASEGKNLQSMRSLTTAI
eukprot:3652268-Ditylum_brightwellii.AAC.1